ncbi:MAG: gamma-glutamyltransferase [Undibacterium sp.]|nr:gamma-glutamyltransferase [Opitutaceae bacterium]
MRSLTRFGVPYAFTRARIIAAEATPVTVTPVAAHLQVAAARLAVLKAGGHALDAAVATSRAVGVAEPDGSSLSVNWCCSI